MSICVKVGSGSAAYRIFVVVVVGCTTNLRAVVKDCVQIAVDRHGVCASTSTHCRSASINVPLGSFPQEIEPRLHRQQWQRDQSVNP